MKNILEWVTRTPSIPLLSMEMSMSTQKCLYDAIFCDFSAVQREV